MTRSQGYTYSNRKRSLTLNIYLLQLIFEVRERFLFEYFLTRYHDLFVTIVKLASMISATRKFKQGS